MRKVTKIASKRVKQRQKKRRPKCRQINEISLLYFTYFYRLHVKEEVHDVAVLDYVVFAFDAHLAGGADGGFGLVLDEVLVLDDLGADEAAFEVGVDDTGRGGPCLRRRWSRRGTRRRRR